MHFRFSFSSSLCTTVVVLHLILIILLFWYVILQYVKGCPRTELLNNLASTLLFLP
jgi:hypothetical protein